MSSINPLLTIEPWELPPDCDAPLTAPADFVFRALWQYAMVSHPRETEIRMRVVPYQNAFIHYFCDAKRPRNGNWILSNIGALPFSDGRRRLEELEQTFCTDDDLWFEYVTRLICFDGAPYGFEGQYRIIVLPKGECELEYGLAPLSEKWNWRATAMSSPFTTCRTPKCAATMKDQVFAALNDENSEARFALSWLHLKPHKRRQTLEKFEAQHLLPIQKLMRAILETQSAIWKYNLPVTWQVFSEHPDTSTDKLHGRLLVARSREIEVPPRLTRWRKTIWNHFVPSLENRWLFFATGVRGNSAGSLEVEVEPPTAHERLEAELILRDWWQDKFPGQSFAEFSAND